VISNRTRLQRLPRRWAHTLRTGETEAVCHAETFVGTETSFSAPTTTVHPEYSSCEFSGGPAAVVTTGCNYVSSTLLEFHISCSGTSKIMVVIPSVCTLSFGTQAPSGSPTYTNVGSGASREVMIDILTSAMFTKSGALCFLFSGTSATYSGAYRAAGYEDLGGLLGKQVGIDVT
jgi:hypothetical protein